MICLRCESFLIVTVVPDGIYMKLMNLLFYEYPEFKAETLVANILKILTNFFIPCNDDYQPVGA